MSLINRIFGNSKIKTADNNISLFAYSDNPNLAALCSLGITLNELLSSDSYIAKSGYLAEQNQNFILVDHFISSFKTNGYTAEQFDNWSAKTENIRTKLFLSICKQCYLEYEKYPNKNNAVDFADMINESARLLKESKSVSDDWQSIYAFSGSDITLFMKFSEIMGYAELLKITNTYRNSQEVIDIAGNFIQKNTAQIQKSLKLPKTIKDPVIIYTYDSSRKNGTAVLIAGQSTIWQKRLKQHCGKLLNLTKQKEKTPKNRKSFCSGDSALSEFIIREK